MKRASIIRRHPARIFAGLALAAVCWTPGQAQTATPTTPGAPQRTSLIASGDVPDLFLLYTGDVIGYLDPCG